MKHLTLIAALCASLPLAACGEDSSGNSGEEISALAKAERAKIREPKVKPPPDSGSSRLVVEDLKEGFGRSAEAGDEITIHYVGVDESGKKTWFTWGREGPLVYQLGSGTAIEGWERGLEGMKVGGRRQLTIPSELATGDGAMVYVVDLIAVEDPSKSAEAAWDKLVIKDLKEGSGPGAGPGDEIVTHFVRIDFKTGRKADARFDRGKKTASFMLGVGDLIQGWEIGMQGMKVGGRRKLVVPSKLGYDSSTLVYVVDLVAVR